MPLTIASTHTVQTHGEQLFLLESAAKAAATAAATVPARKWDIATIASSATAALAVSTIMATANVTLSQHERNQIITKATTAALANIAVREKITCDTHPHIFQTIRANAPYSVELAFRKAFHEVPLHPAVDWPRRVVLARPDGVNNIDTPPELSGPNGELVIPADPNNYFSRPRNYIDFAKLLKRHRDMLHDVRVLDIIDDIGRQGARPVLRATPNLEVIRFIPERLLFSGRAWTIHVPKAVVFAKIPLPDPNSPTATAVTMHDYFPWHKMLIIDEPSKLQTLILNVTFNDDRPAAASPIPGGLRPDIRRLPPNVVVIFTDAEHSSKSEPATLHAPLSERKNRFLGICDFIRFLCDDPLILRRGVNRKVTLVGIDQVYPAVFGLDANERASHQIHNYLHRSNRSAYCCPGRVSAGPGRGAAPIMPGVYGGSVVGSPLGGRQQHPQMLYFQSLKRYEERVGAEKYAVETVW